MTFLFERTHWGRIRLTGADRVRFLHNQTTNNIEQLSAQQGCHTVFVTSTGRTIDLATTYAFSDSLLIVVSPGMAKQLYDWMDRYIFFSDKVTLTDESDETFMFTVLGDGVDETIAALGEIDLKETFAHQTIEGIAGNDVRTTEPVTIASGTDLAIEGYTILGSQQDAEIVKNVLIAAGASAKSQADWEALRIQQGRPMPPAELTDDDNPLEAGLWDSISFEKGCYIGQETIARLNTYNGVKKKLWGLQMETPLPESAPTDALVLKVDDRKVGRLTSLSAARDFGLGYVRTKAGGEGLEVMVEGEQISAIARTVAVPFVGES